MIISTAQIVRVTDMNFVINAVILVIIDVSHAEVKDGVIADIVVVPDWESIRL